MEVVVTAGAIGRSKLPSNHHHQQTNIHNKPTDATKFLQLPTTDLSREALRQALKADIKYTHILYMSVELLQA